jgi:hypothetical protein
MPGPYGLPGASLRVVPDLRRTALVVGAGAGITGDGLFLTALAWRST